MFEFGLTGVLAAPRIELYDSRGLLYESAGAWSASRQANDIRTSADTVGAFALEPDSRDAALVTTLPPGSWTVQIGGENNTTGACAPRAASAASRQAESGSAIITMPGPPPNGRSSTRL